VDIVLEPTGQQSAKEYPNDTSDVRILWQQAEPSLKTVETAAKAPTATASLHASNRQN
jgi:hypothetical protein